MCLWAADADANDPRQPRDAVARSKFDGHKVAARCRCRDAAGTDELTPETAAAGSGYVPQRGTRIATGTKPMTTRRITKHGPGPDGGLPGGGAGSTVGSIRR